MVVLLDNYQIYVIIIMHYLPMNFIHIFFQNRNCIALLADKQHGLDPILPILSSLALTRMNR